MISHYSSYLEFLGAVYFSMSLDDILKKKIWSPENSKGLARALDGIDIESDDLIKTSVLNANTKKGLVLQSELNKKSIIGLFCIAFLLIYCGYEQSIEKTNGLLLSHIHILLTFFVEFSLLLFFRKKIFQKWNLVSLYIISMPCIYFLIESMLDIQVLNTLFVNVPSLGWGLKNKFLDIVIHKNGIVICMILSLSIIWQIFISWLFSRVFYGYIKEKIKDANDVYLKAKDDQSCNNIDALPPRYKDIITRKTLQTESSTSQVIEDSLSEFKDVLCNDIINIGNEVRIYQLVISWFKYKIKSIFDYLKSFNGSDDIDQYKKK